MFAVETETAICKWFCRKTGIGYIIAENGGYSVFVHHSSINMDGYKFLYAGQKVAFAMDKWADPIIYKALLVCDENGGRIRNGRRRANKSRCEKRASAPTRSGKR